MLDLSSTQILLHPKILTAIRPVVYSTMANSPVLDKLMPQLAMPQLPTLKPRLLLQSIDPYMLQETQQLITRISEHIVEKNLPDHTQLKIRLKEGKLHLTGKAPQQLHNLLGQDSWLASTFAWLLPNYIGLTHSQEMLRFSYAYEIDRQQAIDTYRHFEQIDQGLDCYLKIMFGQNKPLLHLCIESPMAVYLTDNQS